MTDQERQSIVDEEHLKLLRIGYIVIGVADLFFALIPPRLRCNRYWLGAAGIQLPTRAGEPSLAFVGWFSCCFGVLLSIFFAVQAVLQLMRRPGRSVNGARGSSARLRLRLRVFKCPGACRWQSYFSSVGQGQRQAIIRTRDVHS